MQLASKIISKCLLLTARDWKRIIDKNVVTFIKKTIKIVLFDADYLYTGINL